MVNCKIKNEDFALEIKPLSELACHRPFCFNSTDGLTGSKWRESDP